MLTTMLRRFGERQTVIDPKLSVRQSQFGAGLQAPKCAYLTNSLVLITVRRSTHVFYKNSLPIADFELYFIPDDVIYYDRRNHAISRGTWNIDKVYVTLYNYCDVSACGNAVCPVLWATAGVRSDNLLAFCQTHGPKPRQPTTSLLGWGSLRLHPVIFPESSITLLRLNSTMVFPG